MASKEAKENLEEKEKIEKIKTAIDKVYKSDEAANRRKKMTRFLSEYMGVWWKDSEGRSVIDAHESQAALNYVFSTVQSLVPLLTDNRPVWSVISRHAHEQTVADLYNNALEYLWDKIGMDDHLGKLVLNGVLFGVGIGKVGYDPDDDEVFIDVEDPRNFVIAPGYEDEWKAPWMGIIKKIPLSYIKLNYPDAEVEADSGGTDEDDKYTKEESDRFSSQQEYVTVYEIWMVDPSVEDIIISEDEDGEHKETKETVAKYPNGRIITFTKDAVVLDDKPSPFNHGKPPYIAFHDYRVPGSFWSMGEVDQIENLNREFNLRLSQLVDHARKFSKPNYIASKALGIKQEALKQAIRTGDQVLMTDSQVAKDLISEIPVPTINNAVLALLNNIPRWIEEVSGVTDISKGVDDKKERRSASEASILIESSYTRVRQKVRNLESYIKKTAFLMIELMQQYYDTPRQFTNVRDNEVTYKSISNSPNIIADEVGKNLPDTSQMVVPELELTPEDKQAFEDYDKLIESFKGKDEVFFKFDIQIQTNSTLPADKQSLVNMALRLLEMKAIDEQAVLEITRFPNATAIINRMKEKQEQEQQAKAGPPPPQGGPPPQQPQQPPPQQQPNLPEMARQQ